MTDTLGSEMLFFLLLPLKISLKLYLLLLLAETLISKAQGEWSTMTMQGVII